MTWAVGVGVGVGVPPLREQHPCQSNSRCCFRNFWKHGIWRFLFWWFVKINFFQ